MSDDSSSTSEDEVSITHSNGLTDTASGEGHPIDRGVGMSTPLPNPPHEKEAVDEGLTLAANSSASRAQHKGSCVDSSTEERNTSQPPDTVRPSPIVSDEPGQGNNNSRQYGAWFSTYHFRQMY